MNMTLAIYCAGGLGHEVLYLFKTIQEAGKYQDWNVIYVDDNLAGTQVKGTPVLPYAEVINTYQKNHIRFVIASGEPQVRFQLREKILQDGFLLETLIHPSVTVPKCAQIGMGVLIFQGCILSTDINISDNVIIDYCAIIGHDVKLGIDCVILCNVGIMGDTILRERVFVGSASAIKNGIIINKDAVVGMGSIVIRDVLSSTVVIGNPAKLLRVNDTKKIFL